MPKKSKPVPKLIVSEVITEFSPGDFEGLLGNLQSLVDELVQEHGPTATIRWDPDNWLPYDESPTPVYRLTVEREETEEEFAKRLDTIAENEAKTLARDLAEFERLKLKLTGKK